MSKPNKNRKKYYETYKQENRRLKNKEKKREKQVGRYQDGSSRNYRSRNLGHSPGGASEQ